MYRINVYDFTGVTQLTSLFVPANVYGLQYSTELSKAGSATFKIKTLDSKATATNLQLYNRIKIYNGGSVVFSGFIETLQVDVNEIEVQCPGILALFQKRIKSLIINGSYMPTSGVAAFKLLTDTNADQDTGIVAGTDTTANTLHNLEMSHSPIFTSWQKLVQLADTDMEIDFDGNFNIGTVGTDKSATVIFRYIQGQINTATMYEFDVQVSGKDMANSIRGKGSSWSITATSSDAASKSQFGLLEKMYSSPQNTGSVADLTAELDTEVLTDKQEFYVPKVRPNLEKMGMDDFIVGDVVGMRLSNGFIDVDETYRVIKKSVRISDSLTPVVDVGLIQSSNNKLPSSFFDDIIDLRDRVGRIEETS